MDYALIGERIRKSRKEVNMTQEEFAEFCGISRLSVLRYENGSSTPNRAAAEKIAKACNTTVDYVLDRDEKEQSKRTEGIVSDRLTLFMREAQDLNDNEIEIARMFLKQLKKGRD